MDDRVLASDSERDQTVARLSSAQAQGRLTLNELQSRTAEALQARTRGQLHELTSDLPGLFPGETSEIAQAPANLTVAEAHFEPPRERNPTAIVEALHPSGMRSAWTVWAAVSGANFVLWLLISVINGANVYPWFFWIAGPWGIALLAHTAHSQGSRHDKGEIAQPGTQCHMPPSGSPEDPRPYQDL